MKKDEDEGPIVSVMTWNILAHRYLQRNLPSHLPTKLCSRDRRRKEIRRILSENQSDVICLQEVDDYQDHWVTIFGNLGFRSKYDCRQSKKEGLCLLYRSHRVSLIEIIRLELNDVVKHVNFPSEMHASHHHRNSLAQIALMEHVADGSRFIVVNAHIFWNPSVTDVKLFQVYFLSHRVHEVAQNWGPNLPIIFGGDLNSMPGGVVVNLLTTSHIDPLHPEFLAHFQSRYPQLLKQRGGPSAILNLPFAWKCALENNCFFTNYTANFRAQIDYLLTHGPVHVDHAAIVGATEQASYKYLADEDFALTGSHETNDVHEYPLLPSAQWPSDHLAVRATFKLLGHAH